jgi:hypothetical protein
MKRLLKWLLLGVLLASFLAGCAPAAAPAPQVVKETVVVKESVPVKETVVVEKKVEVPVEKTVVVEKKVEVPSAVPEWELVNPAGAFKIIPMEIASRITTLEGKTVVLYWNAKPNGNLFLDRVAELLTQQVKGIKIIKLYEVDPSTAGISGGAAVSQDKATKIAAYKPDLVVGSTAD